MDKEQKLEQLLHAYMVPSASDDLADRIIRAASRVEQKQNVWQWVSRMCEEFRLPLPAYSFASLLLIGFFAGFIYPDTEDYAATDTVFEQLFYESGAIL